MNTTVSLVGPWCCGKTTFGQFMQRKYVGTVMPELIFPDVQKRLQREVVVKRNEALEDQSKMFDFLAFLVQKAAKEAMDQFQKLEARQFLVLEQQTEYLDMTITAAKNIRLISVEQWRQLRTLVDELAPTFITDVFVLFSVEDYDLCGNFHQKSGRSEHRVGAPLQRWNEEIGKLQKVWEKKQRARGKLVVHINSRISRFARSRKAKQLLNVVMHFSNVHHGTDFQLRGAAATAEADEEAEIPGLSDSQQLAISKATSSLVIIMPPKKSSTAKSSEATKSGTAMEGMDAQGLHDETLAYQMQVQRMQQVQMQMQQRGPRPRSSSAGLYRPQPRLSQQMPGPRMMRPGQGGWAPRGMGGGQFQPPTRPVFRQSIGQMRALRPQVAAHNQREEERARLRRRLAELDEEQRIEERGPRGSSRELSRGEERYPLYPQGRRELYSGGESYRRDEGTRFMKEDQERISDANMRKRMAEATSKMLSSAGFARGGSLMPDMGRGLEDISENEKVSEDSSNDSSDTEERKRKTRQRNKKRDAKRKKKESYGLEPSSRQANFGPLDYYQGSMPPESYGGQSAEMEEVYWPRSNYFEGNTDQGWFGQETEPVSQDWGEEEDYPYTQADPSQYGGGAGYSGEGHDYDQEEDVDAQGKGPEDSVQESEASWGEEKEDPEMTLNDDEFQEEEEESQEKGEKEKPFKIPKIMKGKTLAATGKGGKSSKKVRSEDKKEEVGEKDEKKGKKLEEVDLFPAPEAPAKRTYKKKIVKVSPAGGTREEGSPRKKVITQEEMETALSNLKKEDTTPPRPLSDTMKSNDFKTYLAEHMDDELAFEMNVRADKHFPKLLQQPSENLTELLPKLHAKVYEQGVTPKPRGPPGPPQQPQGEDVAQPSQADKLADRSAVSLSQDEIEDLAEFDESENDQMKAVLLESKMMALADEEKRKEAWAALGQLPPGPSRAQSTPEKVRMRGQEAKPHPVQKTPGAERKLPQKPPKVVKEGKAKSVEKTLTKSKVTKEDSVDKKRRVSFQEDEVKKGKNGEGKEESEEKGKRLTKGSQGKPQMRKKAKEDAEEEEEK